MAGMAGLSFGSRPTTTQSRQLAELYAAQKGAGQPMLRFQNPANAPPGKIPMPTSNAGTWANTGTVVKPAMAAATPPQASAGLVDDPGLVSSLRPQPNPQAGIGEAEKPASSMSPMMGLMQMFMNQMMGIKTPKKPIEQPQAPVQEAAPNKFDRASRLFEIGAGLL
jgi:hypothetical protein